MEQSFILANMPFPLDYLIIHVLFSEIHAYDNTAFNNGSSHEMEERRADSKMEVERMGYEMYNGKHENRWALRLHSHVFYLNCPEMLGK